MNHFTKYSAGYCLIAMALANAFAQQFKGVTHEQVANMNWLDWAVSMAEFVAAAGTVFAAYLQKYPSYEISTTPVSPKS